RLQASRVIVASRCLVHPLETSPNEIEKQANRTPCTKQLSANERPQTTPLANSALLVDLMGCPLHCLAGRRMLASPARHGSELQRHIEPAAHGISDEGQSSHARAGNAQGLGGDAPLPGNSKIARGQGAICSARR